MDHLHDEVIRIEPDLTFVIDMDPDTALSRGLARRSGEDRFEDMGAAFQHKLRAGFLDLARAHPDRCRLIDGNRPAEAVAAEIAAQVLAAA